MILAKFCFKYPKTFTLPFKSCFSSLNAKNYLDKKALCTLSNYKVMDSVLERKWDEAVILIEQAKILNHSFDKTTCLLEALVYKLGYNRDDKVNGSLKYVQEDPTIEVYFKHLLQIITKLENDELYKMDKKEFRRILEIMQDSLE